MEGVPAPRGNLWHSTAIAGETKHKRGILRNEIYVGILAYGYSRMVVNPQTRRRLMRPNAQEEVIRQDVPELRIISDDVWQQVQARLAENTTTRPERSEEHTSELQSLMRISYAVFCLKKKKHTNNQHDI